MRLKHGLVETQPGLLPVGKMLTEELIVPTKQAQFARAAAPQVVARISILIEKFAQSGLQLFYGGRSLWSLDAPAGAPLLQALGDKQLGRQQL